MVSKVTWVRELLWLQFLSQLVLIEQSLSLNVITHHHIIKWLCLAYNLHKFNTIHQHQIHACNIWSEAKHAINDFVLHLALYKLCRAITKLRIPQLMPLWMLREPIMFSKKMTKFRWILCKHSMCDDIHHWKAESKSDRSRGLDNGMKTNLVSWTHCKCKPQW